MHAKQLSFFSLCISIFIFLGCQPVEKTSLATLPNSSSQAENLGSLESTLVSLSRIETFAASMTTSRENNDPIIKEMKQLLQDANCLVVYKKSREFKIIKDGLLDISGVNCPIQAHYELLFKEAQDSGLFSLSAKFLINDKTLKAKNDVYEIDLSGSGRVIIENSKLLIRLNSSGTISSESKGLIQFNSSQVERQNIIDPNVWTSGWTKYNFIFPTTKKS